MGINPDQFLAKVTDPVRRAEYEAQIRGARNRMGPAPVAVEAKPLERRVRQSPIKLNKLEEAYLGILTAKHGEKNVLAQEVRLRLANGLWYKADFFIPKLSLFIETKGPHAHRGGFENLKMAATQHTWATFHLVWRKQGTWYFQLILP